MAFYEGNTGADLSKAAEEFNKVGDPNFSATLHLGENLLKQETMPKPEVKPDLMQP